MCVEISLKWPEYSLTSCDLKCFSYVSLLILFASQHICVCVFDSFTEKQSFHSISGSLHDIAKNEDGKTFSNSCSKFERTFFCIFYESFWPILTFIEQWISSEMNIDKMSFLFFFYISLKVKRMKNVFKSFSIICDHKSYCIRAKRVKRQRNGTFNRFIEINCATCCEQTKQLTRDKCNEATISGAVHISVNCNRKTDKKKHENHFSQITLIHECFPSWRRCMCNDIKIKTKTTTTRELKMYGHCSSKNKKII